MESRSGLGLQNALIVTVAVLTAKGMFDNSFKHHMETARQNGVTREEMAEVLTHAAFYAGWPNVWAAFRVACETYAPDGEGHGLADGLDCGFGSVFGLGS